VRLGRASYEVYIVQMPLMYWLMVATSHGLVNWRGAGFLLRFTPLVVGVALTLHVLVDRWAQPLAERALALLLAAPPRRLALSDGSGTAGRGARPAPAVAPASGTSP
jgi:peptidoglycan/LPS O-acetylase OafA/YrhL